MKKNQDAGAITGQPIISEFEHMKFPEKLNIITNLINIFPHITERDLIDVGFAEGRCDGFKMDALEKVGFHDYTLSTAGEDQVLAAKLRKAGYKVYKAPKLHYFLSVSDNQDTIWKIIKHQKLFGLVHPFILIKNKGTVQGIMGEIAGENRKKTAILRFSQIAASMVYLTLPLTILSSNISQFWFLSLALVLIFKFIIFYKHLSIIPMKFYEKFIFWTLQPIMDLAYTIGIFQGFIKLIYNDQVMIDD